MLLSDRQVREAKPREKPYKLFDGDGLYVLVQPTGAKYWRFKYRYLNKEKVMAFGVYPEISLADARDRRFTARKLKANDVDPGEFKKQQRRIAIQNDRNTFEHIAREWHSYKAQDHSPYYARQIMQRLENDVFPKIGHRPINSITAPELLKMVRAIEARGALDLSHRAVQISGQVFQYAILTERAERNPTTDLRGFLRVGQKKHYAYLTERELPAFISTLQTYKGSDQTKRAIKLLMLTFVRTAELIGARWSEIDFEKCEWRIPSERMKMRSLHVVPLAAPAMELLRILKRLNGHGEFVFPSIQGHRKPMSNATMLAALAHMGYKGKTTIHGFRATASTILNESGLFERDVIEHQLAHQERNKVRASYNHAEHLPSRRKMMEWYANFLAKAGLHVS